MSRNETIRSFTEQSTEMKLLPIICLGIFSAFHVCAQNEHPSIHEQQLNEYNALGNANATYYESLPTEITPASPGAKVNCNLNKIVYGWHPYWIGSAYQNYQWDLLSHMAFFSYEVNAADGQPTNTHGWSTSAAVTAALASGNTKVTLCVTLFSGHATFFANPTAQQTLITNLINLVQSRGAHGVNIDFEGIPGSQGTNFANFMVNLSNQMHTAIPGSEVSTALYAVDWGGVFDFSIMEPVVDHYIIMGYDYYYSGSSTAGPTDPLYQFGTTYNYTLSRSITYYLDMGCPKEKLVLGLPNYGYEWPTTSQIVPSSTTGSGTARIYSYVRNNTSGNYSVGNQTWQSDSYTDVFAFNTGTNRQCLISLDSAWRKRLEHVNHAGIAGIGIWALGYDNGYSDLWLAMEDYLTDCYVDPCAGTIHDFGGPTKNYYNNEDYTWTIAPAGAISIDVNFTMFNVEANYDYLYIYDGPDDTYPQLPGSPFTGTTSPGAFTTSSGAVTFRFYSDGATVAPGFLADYYCTAQLPPTANFSVNQLTVCAGDSIALVNNSIDADDYAWSTDLGVISDTTVQNPYLVPSTSGNYAITLSVSNAAGTDQQTQSVFIQVNQPPVAGASVSNSNLSLPNAIAYFSNSSTNASSYQWQFGDGSSSTDTQPWHEYTASGVYTVLLIVSNDGCMDDTTTLTITVGQAALSEVDNGIELIYPNPFQQEISIVAKQPIVELTVFDAAGRKILSKASYEGTKGKLSIHSSAAGEYLLKITTDSGSYYRRIIKE